MKKVLPAAFLVFFLLYGIPAEVTAQETFPENGVRDERPDLFAFTNATIVVKAGEIIENGTLLIKDGKIVSVGANVQVPEGAVVRDLEGKFIYPSLIDLYTSYGMPQPPEVTGDEDDSPQFLSEKSGAYGWNESIRAEYVAAYHFSVDEKEAEKFRKMGFGTVLSHNKDGIARGSSVFVSLGTERDNKELIKEKAATHYSFNKGSSGNDYPTSLMGAIALLRQTWYDAQWHAGGGRDEVRNLSLEAFWADRALPRFFEATDVLNIQRADRIGDEFDVQFIFKGNGDSYQRIELVKASGGALVVPLNFPKAFDMEDPYEARQVSLAQMKHWELAPYNPARLEAAGLRFALTSEGAGDDFWTNLRKAIELGLSAEQALRSLTDIPAGLIGLDSLTGTLEPGKLANFLITSSDLFAEDNVIYENWVQGKGYVINDLDFPDIRGVYTLRIAGLPEMEMSISGRPLDPEISVKAPGEETSGVFQRGGELFSLLLNLKETAGGKLRLNGLIPQTSMQGKPAEPGRTFPDKDIESGDDDLEGEATLPEGETVEWRAHRTGTAQAAEELAGSRDTPHEDKQPVGTPGPVIYPFTAFGREQQPAAEKVLIRNATVWTNEAEGILETADVLINNGKIAAVGQGLSTGGATVIDAGGKHLTPGIIDEHSHIAATGGINEAGQAVSAEVRIGDIINSEDIDIYRQLAGGVTTSQILHGSANPIGGQSQLIKLRWGLGPEGLKFENAAGFIKFALGENVKQSNWGDSQTTRFPQTRMGVQQVMMDAFQRAREYEQAGAAAGNIRRDLELDALVEILNQQRFITCHSYVQSEIAMLMQVADSMGFSVNTFTHILEGYKVADKMKAHGAAGSTFSDWWAYKVEVKDAIPYNAAIMHETGILTGINSDDAEMARRLNQEAAKTIKYGGLSEEDAFKLISLNPAKMLHIDDQVGSIKVGKDADLVIWSDNPLSIYARVEKTFVDGVPYFDAAQDSLMRQHLKQERARLAQKMLAVKHNGGETQQPAAPEKIYYHCEDVFDEFKD